MNNPNFGETLKRVTNRESLSAAEAADAFSAIMRGEVSPPRMAAFLTALALRSPTVDEIVGAVRAMRLAMKSIQAPENAIDVCGTGGDGLGTLNVSTAVAFVVAGCGVPVAKHGNRNMSSQTGAADVLEKLGFQIEIEPSMAEECLAETGFCFLFAPKYHAAMKHVAPVRRELGFRTIFNLLGPLSNPAGVRRQLVGVYSQAWTTPVACVLRDLGSEAAWVVHSEDGMDEISIACPTRISALQGGNIFEQTITPEQGGLGRAPIESILGGAPEQNASAIRDLLSGFHSAFRDIVLLNAAAALVMADRACDVGSAIALAAEAVDSGSAREVLNRAAAISRASQ